MQRRGLRRQAFLLLGLALGRPWASSSELLYWPVFLLLLQGGWARTIMLASPFCLEGLFSHLMDEIHLD